MADPSHIEELSKGASSWNAWRANSRESRPDLSDLDFESVGPEPYDIMNLREFEGFDFSDCHLNRISARNCTFLNCSFAGSRMPISDLCFAFFQDCDFSRATLRVTRLGSAEFVGCNFSDADLSYATAQETGFEQCDLMRTILNHASLVQSRFSSARIVSAHLYGASVWDVDLTGATQDNIFINELGTGISVPSIELAQFVALLLDNRKVRDFIDTMTSKMVLILGRFTPGQKRILDRLKSELSVLGYLPIICDFDEPGSRDVRETIKTLAALSRFTIVDLTNPKSVPLELEAIVPQFPSLPVQPIIEAKEKPFGMFESIAKFQNVMPVLKYDGEITTEDVLRFVSQCENQEW